MQAVPFLSLWAPRIPLNTDIAPIEKIPMPAEARLYTRDRAQEANAGDTVKTGQRLAADLVSPVTGTVKAVETVSGYDGEPMAAISLDVAEKDEIQEGLESVTDFSTRGKDELAARLSALGFDAPIPPEIDVAVVSCLDTDPLHTVNQQAFREGIDTLEDALALLRALTGAERIVLAVTAQLRNLAKRKLAGQAEVLLLEPVYPNGLPDLVQRELARKDRGASKGFVIGAERLFAMATSLKTGKPRQTKLVTLCVPQAGLCKTLQVWIGTPIAAILDQYKISPGAHSKLITGGVMRGVPCHSTGFAVTPATDSIIVQDETRVVEFENNPCLHCGKCSASCPMDLRVDLICRHAEYGLFDECGTLAVDACIECGLCSYTCPARRPLVHLLKLARTQLREQASDQEEAA